MREGPPRPRRLPSSSPTHPPTQPASQTASHSARAPTLGKVICFASIRCSSSSELSPIEQNSGIEWLQQVFEAYSSITYTDYPERTLVLSLLTARACLTASMHELRYFDVSSLQLCKLRSCLDGIGQWLDCCRFRSRIKALLRSSQSDRLGSGSGPGRRLRS